VEFRILGPLEVADEHGPKPLGAAKQRLVLAVLLLSANRVVSRDRLVDAVWGDAPPDTATTALQGYVSGLRKVLGPERLVTRPPGYLLQVEPGSLDLDRFEGLVDEAAAASSAGDAERGRDLLRRALECWRGEAFADLDGTAQVIAAERRRLEELRLAALEDRLTADLALGRHAEVVAELTALVAAEPLRERSRGLLMLALYRSGRQAEALDVYARGRRLLAEELGLEPGAELQQLQRAILAQDRSLAGPPPRLAAARPRARPGRLPLLAALAVGTVAVAAALLLTRRTGDVAVAANSVAVVEPAGGRVLRDVRFDDVPVDVAAGFDSAWVALAGGTVERLDSEGDVVARLDVGSSAGALAVGFDAVWVTDDADGTVVRIDPASNVVEARVRVGAAGGPVVGLAVGPQALWTTAAGTLVRIDPEAVAVVSRYPLPPASALAVDPDDGAVWLVTQDGRLLELVPGLESIGWSLELDAQGAAPTAVAGALWLLVYSGHGEIWRVERTDAPPRVVGPGRAALPLDLAVTGRDLWTVDSAGTVVRRDRATGRVLDAIATAPTIRAAVAVGSGRVWVAVQQPT
jgi:DNA-binding SARP family transcriptional activator